MLTENTFVTVKLVEGAPTREYLVIFVDNARRINYLSQEGAIYNLPYDGEKFVVKTRTCGKNIRNWSTPDVAAYLMAHGTLITCGYRLLGKTLSKINTRGKTKFCKLSNEIDRLVEAIWDAARSKDRVCLGSALTTLTEFKSKCAFPHEKQLSRKNKQRLIRKGRLRSGKKKEENKKNEHYILKDKFLDFSSRNLITDRKATKKYTFTSTQYKKSKPKLIRKVKKTI